MNSFALAITVHLTAIVVWIGGVGFITTVLFPTVRRSYPPAERLAAFLRIEEGFAWQARISVALAGASGLVMVGQMGLWHAFADGSFWWLHAMVCLWTVFAVMLFVAEPLVLHRRWAQAARHDPQGQMFLRLHRLHRILFALSLLVVMAATGGAHGLF